jgi:subtilisin family serine protease
MNSEFVFVAMTTDISRRRVLGGTAGAFGVLSVGTATAQSGGDRYIVGVDSPAARRAATARADAVRHVLDFGAHGTAVAGRFPSQAIDALRGRADVRYVEPDATGYAVDQTLPWGIDRIDADVAQSNGTTGTGADIAIIDTGIDSDHPDLQANLGTGNAYVSCDGSNGATCDQPWDDDNGHGTHCAGIAGAVDNTEGVVGAASGATLHAVKVLGSDGSGTYSDIAAGIKWTADQGYDVGNLSLGGTEDSQGLADACRYATDRGVLLAAAAGNSGPCSDCVLYPARYSTVIAVSATAKDDTLADFSSTGPEIELAAPGRSIYSTLINGYDTKSGTSMSCPHVAGTAGLLMANDYTDAEARQTMQETAEDLGLSKAEQGYGLVDAEAAVATIGSTPPTSETGTVSVDQPDGTTWRTATLEQSYDDPVVVMNPPSYNGGQPCHIRLRNVGSGSFEYKIEEWRYDDGAHTTESIDYLVAESGTYTSPNGYRIEVGATGADHTFTDVSFTQQFTQIPVVLTQAQTYNGGDPIVTRQRDVSAAGTQVRVQEEEARGRHRTETIGYIAVAAGSTAIDGTEFELGRTADTVTDSWHGIGFQRNHASPRLFADMQTFDGPDPAGLRYRQLSNTDVEVKVEEERSADTETDHTTEVVGYAVADPVPPIGETGSVSVDQPDGTTWRTATLEQSYDDPVVVMNPPSYNGGQPCHIRLRNVGSGSFEYKIEEWRYDDGAHTTESIDYLVAESGTYTSPNGYRIEVGATGADHTFTDVSFTQQFTQIPVVLTQAQTYNGGDPIVTRQRDVSMSGTQVRVQEEEARGKHLAETVGYIAAEPGASSLSGVSFEADRTSDSVTDTWSRLEFTSSYDTPQFLADMQTFDGSDSAGLRYRQLSNTDVEVKVEEERSADTETDHTTEVVGYFVLGSEGSL